MSEVVLSGTQPEWAQEFELVAAEVRAALGGRALAVDHIGSTAVPGLAAKDVIDVQVRVEDLDGIELPGFDTPLGTGAIHDHVPAGDTHDRYEWEKRYFRRLEPRRVHVHVRRQGSANARYALLFRDYLRANDGARRAWEAVKRQVAAAHPDREGYAVAKDPLTDELMHDAERWAVAAGWSLPG